MLVKFFIYGSAAAFWLVLAAGGYRAFAIKHLASAGPIKEKVRFSEQVVAVLTGPKKKRVIRGTWFTRLKSKFRR